MNLLPCPRVIRREAGFFSLSGTPTLWLEPAWKKEAAFVAKRLSDFDVRTVRNSETAEIRILRRPEKSSDKPGCYRLQIGREGISVEARDRGGLFSAIATLRQLLREYGRQLPRVRIDDWPDFPRRGFMLDISRGRVPKLETLLQLVDHLADFKINELQLYTEHTFAYRKYRAVWKAWGALTAREIQTLDARCRELGIDLVPNQNSFGHLREFLAHAPLKKLAEVSTPYESGPGSFLRYPSTLAPSHPETIPFLRGLYDELLPNFSSDRFNVGCDETWDLGRGQSKSLCERTGKGRVYLNFLKKIHAEVRARNRTTMFWGDIVLHHPKLISELPKNVIVLNWGYEANHPFDREAGCFAKAGIPFYVCPGTSTWMTLIGRHDNALTNLAAAAKAGRKHGAEGYLITDWGDGGHPQPLAVSYIPLAAGAAFSWCAETFDRRALLRVLDRDVFKDASEKMARAALDLGFVHRKLRFFEPNLTPLGTVIAAPLPESRELFCRDGLKYYARTTPSRIRAAIQEMQRGLDEIKRSKPRDVSARVLRQEIELAVRMALESCRYMLWQQAVASGKVAKARQMATAGIVALRKLEKDFARYWPLRNKATPSKCAPFLRWRQEDYREGKLHFPPDQTRG